MPKISNKVSVYGDSMRDGNSAIGLQSTAQRLLLDAKFNAGVNDFAIGGNSFAASTAGTNQIFGRTFQSQITNFDDCDICAISLGTNDLPGGIVAGTRTPVGSIPSSANFVDYVGSDFLPIGANALIHVQQALAASKRPVLIGVPYASRDHLLASGGGIFGADVPELAGWTTEQRRDTAAGLILKISAVNACLRVISGTQNIPIIVPYGAPIAPNMILADYNSVIDGIHHTQAYGHALSDWIGTELVRIFSL